jgi:hypothetical protein
MKLKSILSILFIIAAIYDGLLGAIFLLAPSALFIVFDVTLPNHPGYVQFPAALLIIFALMFTALAIDPLRNRNLLPYGILLKVAYSGIVFYYWATGGIPGMWKPFAVIDLAFMLVFIWAYRIIPMLRKPEPRG